MPFKKDRYPYFEVELMNDQMNVKYRYHGILSWRGRALRDVLIAVFLIICASANGQVNPIDTTNVEDIKVESDSSIAVVNFDKSDTTVMSQDTASIQQNDVSPLDIGSSRGIFILSSNRLLQLRILGSVRANFNYDGQLLLDNQTFNPYEIPTDTELDSPNFFAGLGQSRLAFEVTRRTKTKGDIFIRLEGDFINSGSSFRIRHAYGQIGGILIGQTWSLINNVGYQPAFVSLDGPAGGSGLRTPQIRYSSSISKNLVWNVAIEYSAPALNIPDTLDGTVLKVIPDLTGRFSYLSDLISFRAAAAFSTLSGRNESDELNYSFGYAASVSGWAKVSKNGRVYLTVNTGKGSAHYLDMFNGKNENVAFNTVAGQFASLVSTSGFLAYNHELPANLSTSLSFGVASITNVDFQPDDAYHYSYNALFNIFWVPAEGARAGLEYAFGRRFDKAGTNGRANRISMLMYYDF